jgi:hypothetical protein
MDCIFIPCPKWLEFDTAMCGKMCSCGASFSKITFTVAYGVVLHLGLKKKAKTYRACTICMGLECQLASIMLHNKLEVGIGNMRGSREIVINPMSRQS